MRAAFLDPQGTWLARFLPYAAPLAVMTVALATSEWLIFCLAAAAFIVVGFVPWRQRRKQQAEIECGPGFVDVKNVSVRSTYILARSITGATTARTSDGVLLTLDLTDRDEPVSIEVEHETDAERIRKALGIGHDGFGTIGFRAAWNATHKAATVARIVMVIGVLVVWSTPGILLIVSVPITFVSFLLAIAFSLGAHVSSKPDIVMTPKGLQLFLEMGASPNIPYAQVTGIDRHKGCVKVRTLKPNAPCIDVPAAGRWRGLSDEAMSILQVQIMSAVNRARGNGPHKTDIGEHMDALRRHGEHPRDWLARLDVAGQMLLQSSGYRGSAFDSADLWTVLEDPDADVELRTAAARVLSHSRDSDARVRIDTALATVRDINMSNRLRIAIHHDLDLASTELDALDGHRNRVRR
ncbi:MAG: hypothetical protein FWD73_11550 [Polyangiaceae bacterium]|nr:hypothetical protein [Polyangiaceae bacterium]